MTALKKYDRLEATGLWREDAQAQRRDVVVTFGKASLVISTTSDTALTHWSLPAIERINPGQRPALFRPGPDAPESLEIDDPDMIDAIEKIRKTLARRGSKNGRLRFGIFACIVAVIALLGTFWLPGALVRHTVSVVPESKRNSIGEDALRQLTRLTGASCDATLGTQALSQLHARILGDTLRQTIVVPDGGRKTLLLPGGVLVMNKSVVEDYDTPEVAAGYMLAALEAASEIDPLEDILRASGVRATLTLLTSGKVKEKTLENYAKQVLTQGPLQWETDALLGLFDGAKVASTPFARAVDITGEATLDLIEADPFSGRSPAPLLGDGQWVSLQSICGDA